MALVANSKLGPYEIKSALGDGGTSGKFGLRACNKFGLRACKSIQSLSIGRGRRPIAADQR